MKTLELKSTFYREIESLNKRQLHEVYGLFQNYMNGNDDIEDWSNLSNIEQERVLTSIKQADSNNTKPLVEITKRLRNKYHLNDKTGSTY